MNRRCLLCLLAFAALAAGRLWVQCALAAAPFPNAYLLNPTQNQSDIDQQVQAQVAALNDKTTVTDARKWLIDQCPPGVSPIFQSVYAASLNKALQDAISNTNVSQLLRLNAAIVAGHVAEHCKDATLCPVITTLLADKSDAVVLRAVNAAGAVLPAALGDPTANPGDLMKAVISAVQRNSAPPFGGLIAEDAYNALNPKLNIGFHRLSGDTPAILIDANIELQKARAAGYAKAIPENPYCDTYASVYLLDKGVWPELGQSEKIDSVQAASDLIAASGQWVSNGAGDKIGEVIHTINVEASYLHDLASNQFPEPGLIAVLAKLQGEGVGTPAQTILNDSKAVLQGLRNANSTLFANLTPLQVVAGASGENEAPAGPSGASAAGQ